MCPHIHRCIASSPLSLPHLQLEVPCPPGVTIGFVAEHWNLSRAVYSIQNEKKDNVMRVRGPCSTYGCGSDSVFEVNKCKNDIFTSFLYVLTDLGMSWFQIMFSCEWIKQNEERVIGWHQIIFKVLLVDCYSFPKCELFFLWFQCLIKIRRNHLKH